MLLTTTNKIYPATKEQRDLLFAKMKEAGYEWNSEKKELKKIEQKPAWSEEDERILSTLTKYLEEHGGGIDGWECSFLSKWLKSIRPQSEWKPSEEQIEAFKYLLDDYNWDDEVLVSLFNDLKKLREE